MNDNRTSRPGEPDSFRPLDLIADDRARIYVAGFVGDFSGTAGKLQLLTPIDPSAVIPGDFNWDGQVDDLDLVQWEDSFAEDNQADADGDGDSDGAGFLVWQREVTAANAPQTGATVVPEPAGLVLCQLLSLSILLRGRADRWRSWIP